MLDRSVLSRLTRLVLLDDGFVSLLVDGRLLLLHLGLNRRFHTAEQVTQ